MLLPMRPRVLDGSEFWRVGRREFQLDAAALAIGVIAREPAARGLQTIPNDEELAGGKMTPKIFQKGGDPELAEGRMRARMELLASLK
ncbi:MAG: hypothetical protein ACREH9_10505 [Pseudomonadota bacterium]